MTEESRKIEANTFINDLQNFPFLEENWDIKKMEEYLPCKVWKIQNILSLEVQVVHVHRTQVT